MRLPRVQFTIRSVMIAVAIAGAGSAVGHFGRRAGEYRQQAALHGAREAALRTRSAWAKRMARLGYVSGRGETAARAQADHHARLKAVYESAASRPWSPIAPDPPGPK